EPTARNQPAKDESYMQRQELESPVDPVRRLEGFVKRRAAGRGHDLAAKLLDEGSAGAPRAPPGENHRTSLDPPLVSLRLAIVRAHGLGIRSHAGKSKGRGKTERFDGRWAERLGSGCAEICVGRRIGVRGGAQRLPRL